MTTIKTARLINFDELLLSYDMNGNVQDHIIQIISVQIYNYFNGSSFIMYQKKK